MRLRFAPDPRTRSKIYPGQQTLRINLIWLCALPSRCPPLFSSPLIQWKIIKVSIYSALNVQSSRKRLSRLTQCLMSKQSM